MMKYSRLWLVILLLGATALLAGIDEGFESGDFTGWEWQHVGDAQWTVTGNSPHTGSYCAQGGTITHDQTTGLQITYLAGEDGDISFWWKVSSEANYDYLRFYMDGSMLLEIAGTVGWTEVILPVPPGEHAFKWVYEKDYSVSNGSDTGWIDDITFPPPWTPPSWDLRAVDLEAPVFVVSGNDAICDLTVHNNGIEWVTAYQISLFDAGGEMLAQAQVDDSLAPDSTAVRQITWQVPQQDDQQTAGIFGQVSVPDDENPMNDTTPIVNIEILPWDAEVAQAGTQEALNPFLPVHLNAGTSLGQTMFYPDELGEPGQIEQIAFLCDFAVGMNDLPLSVWLMETDVSDLSQGWQTPHEMTDHWEFEVDCPSGPQMLMLPLDPPMEWYGRNLVLTVHRPLNGEVYSFNNRFWAQMDTDYPDRSLLLSANYDPIDPNQPGTGILSGTLPVTLFFKSPLTNGILRGHVTSMDGEDMQEVEVHIPDINYGTTTTETGEYMISGIPEGTWDIVFRPADAVWDSLETQFTIAGGETVILDVTLEPVDAAEDGIPALQTRLYPASPNPFNPSTTIAFDLAATQQVRLDIYNVRGERIRTLVDGTFGQGPHRVIWDGTDSRNQAVASGVYLYRLRTSDTEKMQRMILMK